MMEKVNEEEGGQGLVCPVEEEEPNLSFLAFEDCGCERRRKRLKTPSESLMTENGNKGEGGRGLVCPVEEEGRWKVERARYR